MKSSILKSLSRAIYGDELALAYAGRFSDSLTDKIIGMAEEYLQSDKELKKLRKRTSFLVAECFQNVVRHSSKDIESAQDPSGKESFLIRFHESKVFIASENTLPNEEVDALKKKLDEINHYSRDELKALQKESLEKGHMSEKGGAGLGLIEMARKTGNKLHYSFMSIDEDTSAFYLMIVLEEEKDEAGFADYSAELIQNEFIINSMRSANSFLLYHGDFAQEIIGPVVEMIENNLDAIEGPLASKIKFYNAAIVSMQNISLLSLPEEERHLGTMTMGKTSKGYGVNALNPISKKAKKELSRLLEMIRRTPKPDLDEKIRKELNTGTLSLTADAAQGFIDLARVSKEWKYTFDNFERLPLQFVYKLYI